MSSSTDENMSSLRDAVQVFLHQSKTTTTVVAFAPAPIPKSKAAVSPGLLYGFASFHGENAEGDNLPTLTKLSVDFEHALVQLAVNRCLKYGHLCPYPSFLFHQGKSDNADTETAVYIMQYVMTTGGYQATFGERLDNHPNRVLRYIKTKKGTTTCVCFEETVNDDGSVGLVYGAAVDRPKDPKSRKLLREIAMGRLEKWPVVLENLPSEVKTPSQISAGYTAMMKKKTQVSPSDLRKEAILMEKRETRIFNKFIGQVAKQRVRDRPLTIVSDGRIITVRAPDEGQARSSASLLVLTSEETPDDIVINVFDADDQDEEEEEEDEHAVFVADDLKEIADELAAAKFTHICGGTIHADNDQVQPQSILA